MVRLSDVPGAPGPGGEDAGRPKPKPLPREPAPPSKPATRKTPVEAARANATYRELLEHAESLFAKARAAQPLDLPDLSPALGKLPQDAAERLEVIEGLTFQPDTKNYLYSHSANVALLAYHFSLALFQTEETSQQLALAGLLLDIGMAGRGEDIATAPRGLTPEERTVIEQHPLTGAEHLKRSRGVSQAALESIMAHHERRHGQGYPRGLQDRAISEYAKLLAVCDTYDALTHQRSYRKRMTPAQALKVLIEGAGDEYDRRVVKVFIDELSLYPRGSVVRLNTNEVGIVDRVHAKAPLRPVVLIHRDAAQHRVEPPRPISLLEHPFVYVKEVVAEDEL